MAYYSDINLELKKTTSGDIEEQINAEAIKNSLGNILSTIQGSRRMLPQFALNSNNVLFDQMDEITAYELGDRVLEAIRI
jgi:phage baseplate assembly protein W